MILYYAIGGGFGHLARARRVLTRLGLRDRTVILTAVEEPEITDGIPTITCADFTSFERLIVDAFPCGLLGELRNLDMPMDYVARLLQWDAYAAATGAVMPHFETAYVVEPLTHAIDADRVVELDLSEPPEAAAEEDFWLVAHSGSDDEVRHLTAYARDVQAIEEVEAPIVVARRTFPLAPLLARAARIISAAGFNIMLETQPWRHKHHAVPLPRRFDDQFTRAARRRKLEGQQTTDSGQRE